MSSRWNKKRKNGEKAAKARAGKQTKFETDSGPGDNGRPTTSSADEQFDPSNRFNDWLDEMAYDDMKMLAMFLFYHLLKIEGRGICVAAKRTAELVGREAQFEQGNGAFPESTKGKYVRDCLINDEKLRMRATKWVRENGFVKGKPNMTATDFQHYINETLLPEMHVGISAPHISVETARVWLHKLGFEPCDRNKKVVYIDGHERDDVVAYRSLFLQNLLEDEEAHLPPPKPSDEKLSEEEMFFFIQKEQAGAKKLVTICHDESTFNANDDQTFGWADETMTVLKPKSKGSGMMVSDFIEEHGGFLELTNDEFEAAKASGVNVASPKARKIIEYGENRDGYWTSDRFLEQMESAISIAEWKYPKDEYDLV